MVNIIYDNYRCKESFCEQNIETVLLEVITVFYAANHCSEIFAVLYL